MSQNTKPQPCHITIGVMLRTMFEWEAEVAKNIRLMNNSGKVSQESSQDSFHYKHADIPEDWMCGGLLLLATEIATAIASVNLKWEDGVFDYEHCGRQDENSLWLPTVNKLSADEWQSLCGDNIVPEWVASDVVALMDQLGLVDHSLPA